MSKLTAEERTKLAREAGRASGKVRRAKAKKPKESR